MFNLVKIMLCSSEAAIPVLGRTIENGTTQEWKKLLTVDDLNSSTDLAVRSLTTSNPVKSGEGGLMSWKRIAGIYSKMDCFVRGFDRHW